MLFSGISQSWNISFASYDSVSLSVNSEDASPFGIAFKDDGSKMYVLGNSTDSVYQYSLSTPWDLSTASYDSVSFSVSSQETLPAGIAFKPDGSKMFVTGPLTLYQYSLSTPWDLTSASYDSKSYGVSSEDSEAEDIAFKDDGSKMYVLGDTGDSIYQYSLSTPWDISTVSYDSVSFSIGSEDTNPGGLIFRPDGSKMFMSGNANSSIYQYSLSTPWDLSTASYDSVSFSVSSEDATPVGLFFKPNGTRFYIIGTSSDSAYQYSSI